MSPPNPTCANCGTEVTLRCAGCLDAPEYQPGDSSSVYYCSHPCQMEHRPSHKAHCKSMVHQIKLLRAATILKAALLGYREMAYDIELTKIELLDGTLLLHQKQRAISVPAKRGSFPDHLTADAKHREAALALNQCTTAMALLSGLTRKLLADVPSSIEVLDLHIGNPSLRARLIPGPDSADCPHTVLKVGLLFGKGTWVVDTAGCQYGFRDVLVPYAKYIADKGCRVVNEPSTYSATETKDIDYFLTLPFMTRTKAQRGTLSAERRSRLHFAAFVDAGVGKDILDGSAMEFREKLEGFKSALRLHMSDMTRR